MEKFTNRWNEEFTVQDMINAVRNELNELTDSPDGTQMHRRAVVGKRLHACVHGKNISASGDLFFPVSIRVEGQYTDRYSQNMSTRGRAQALGAALTEKLQGVIGLEA